ncbi:MAG: TolC family protein [Lutibacter sp.]|jgi:outer membrane protein TolC|uniref:TolC family protein n=1 Tax=Lutibacter sp. TaxID=1925666 RepID=UPI00299CE150|nr:TolC family protein [Lutibacter sp.]MDX1828839.1 TolC family protein [Lutibacter sp.]
MNLKIYNLIFFSWLLLLSANAFSQTTLENYLKIAAENNPELKATFSAYMTAMEKVPQVGALPDPQVAFGYFIEPVETRVGPQKWKFNLAQSFPWFGLLEAKENVATDMAKAKFEKFENTKSNLFFEVKTAFYNYYFMEKAINITKQNMDILQVFKRLSLVKIEAGKASIVDELRVELELNDLENKLALFKDTKNTIQTNFNNLLAREVSNSIEIPDTLWQDKLPFDKLNMLDEIYNNNHQLKSIDYRLNAFENQEVVAKKEGLPKFNIGLNYTVVDKNPSSTAVDNGKDAFLFPSVGIKIPIFRKKYKALIKEAKLLQEAETYKKEDKKNVLSTIYTSSYKNYSDGERRIALNKKQAQIAKKVLDVLITSYSTDAKDFEEVLRIERQLLKYELAYQQALIDKNAAIAFMNYLIGK